MNIATFVNSLEGGANIAALRLHLSLLDLGIQSTLYHGGNLSLSTNSPASTTRLYELSKIQKLYSRLYLKYVRNKCEVSEHKFLSSCNWIKSTSFESLPFKPDLVHFVSTHRWLDYRSFFRTTPASVPFVFTLQDFYFLTGGCSYPNDCTHYQFACGMCPILRNPSRHDFSNSQLRLKHHLYSSKSIHLVANTKWTLSVAQRSSLFKYVKSSVVIPNSLDLSKHTYVGLPEARKVLGINSASYVIGFGCLDINDPRKGGKILLEAIEEIASEHNDIVIVTMGLGTWQHNSDAYRVVHLGLINNPVLQSIFYSSLDVLVMPSVVETFGNIAIEANACGTPVICFEISGGLADVVVDRVNGWKISGPPSYHTLSTMLKRLNKAPDLYKSIRRNCRAHAVLHYSSRKAAASYANYFEKILH